MADNREIIIFQCPECKRKNYASTKDKRKNPKKMELKKYCGQCRKHTKHKETKK